MSFALRIDQPAPKFDFVPAVPPVALTDKYRPATLDDMVGQGSAVFQLKTFVEQPYSAAFIFEGETGIGKTTAALALAHDLGCDMTWAVHVIKAGEQDAEAVETALRTLRYTAPGSGWKVVIVDEADCQSVKAAQLWLSALEDLPSRSVVVFTTNHVGKFAPRFVDRCETITFESEAATLMQDVQTLINEVWAKEGAPGNPPMAKDVPNLVDGTGKVSFRRAVRQLEPMIRRARQGEPVVLSRVEKGSKTEVTVQISNDLAAVVVVDNGKARKAGPQSKMFEPAYKALPAPSKAPKGRKAKVKAKAKRVEKTAPKVAPKVETSARLDNAIEVLKRGLGKTDATPAVEAPKVEPTKAPKVAKATRPADLVDWEKEADAYRSGETLRQIGERLSIPPETVHGRLKKLGVVFNQRRAKV